jgi:hypothetical protein
MAQGFFGGGGEGQWVNARVYLPIPSAPEDSAP